MEGEGEQQKKGTASTSHSRQDLRRLAFVRELQATQALRQQRSAQGIVCGSWLDRGRGRHHLPQGMHASCSHPLLPLSFLRFSLTLVFFFLSFVDKSSGLSPLLLQGTKPPSSVGQQQQMEVSPSPSVSPTSSCPGASDGTSLIPWLKGLSSCHGGGGGSSGTASTSSSAGLPPLHVMHGKSASAPVTPPLSSPTARGIPIKTEWDAAIARDGFSECPTHAFSQAAVNAWSHHSSLLAAAAAAATAALNQSHLRPGYCDTPDGCRTPADEVESDFSPATALEFTSMGLSTSSKWADGIRVHVGPAGSAPQGLSSGASGCIVGGMGLGPFPTMAQSETPPETPAYCNPWHGGSMQPAASMPSPRTAPRLLNPCRAEKLAINLESTDVQASWEMTPEALGKRKVPDELELTLGSSSLHASPAQ